MVQELVKAIVKAKQANSMFGQPPQTKLISVQEKIRRGVASRYR